MVERVIAVVASLAAIVGLVALHRWVVRRLWRPVFEAEVADEDDESAADE